MKRVHFLAVLLLVGACSGGGGSDLVSPTDTNSSAHPPKGPKTATPAPPAAPTDTTITPPPPPPPPAPTDTTPPPPPPPPADTTTPPPIDSDGHSTAMPVARADTFHIEQGQTLTVPRGGLLANDSTPNNTRMHTVAASESGFPDPQHGTVTQWDSEGGFWYQPDPDFVGTDSFTYAVEEADGARSESVPIVILVGQP